MQTVKLIDKRWIATSTAHFILEKPKNYNFAAGQYFDIHLPGEKDASDDVNDWAHHFTIASPPDNKTLSFATRMRHSAFKDRLDDLPIGANLQISEPAGDFQFRPSSDGRAVFIAGGIGITPFRSILEDTKEDKEPGSLVLLYSNRRPQDAAFLQELRQLSEGRDKFQMVATITQPDFAELSWDGETGHIDAVLIKKAAPQAASADFYIAGPPGMVEAMQSLVEDAGVPSKQIHAEQFSGY